MVTQLVVSFTYFVFFQVSEKEVGTWLKAIDLKRTLSRKLIENKEGYASSGRGRWRGQMILILF